MRSPNETCQRSSATGLHQAGGLRKSSLSAQDTPTQNLNKIVQILRMLQVDVCKLMPTFPRGMSACVREAFLRMGALDPLLRARLSQWLAYHLSNYDFMWPWDKWKHVLTAPLHDAQR